jgi:hypothetical protein
MIHHKFFLYFFCTFTFCSLLLPVFALADTPPSLVDFQEYFGGGNLKVDVGTVTGIRATRNDPRLDNVQNLGRVPVDGQPNVFIYSAILTYKFEIFATTEATCDNIWNTIPTQSDNSYHYLQIERAPNIYNPSIYPRSYDQFYVNYKSYNVPSLGTGLSTWGKGFDGYIPITMSFTSLAPPNTAFESQNITLVSNLFTSAISTKKIDALKTDTIGNYETKFSSDLINLATPHSELSANTGGAGVSVSQWLSAYGIGFQSASNFESDHTSGLKSADPSFRSSDGAWRVALKPQVIILKQTMNIGTCENLCVSTGSNHWIYHRGAQIETTYTSATATQHPQRNIGWKVQNFRATANVSVTVRISSTITVETTHTEDGKPTENILEITDRTWDDTLDNYDDDIELDLEPTILQQVQEWFSKYWWVILIVAAIGFGFWLFFMSPLAFTLQSKLINPQHNQR